MQVRTTFVALLAAVLIAATAGAAIVAYRQNMDRENLSRVQVLAKAVVRPAGATASTACLERTTACWLTLDSPGQAIAVAAAQMRSAHAAPVVGCNTTLIKIEPTGEHVTCFATVRLGDHRANVSAYHLLQTVKGAPTVVGTLVSVTAF
jgi:hypothetical protein